MIILLILGMLGALLVIVIAGAVITTNFVYTPPFRADDGQLLPGSIAEFKRIKLGGSKQAVLIRGKNVNNPVLLYLHAGPGLSETGMMRKMHAVLEDYYTMVYLDQRGGGKSYSVFTDYQKFTTQQLLQDIHALTLYLKARFNQEKIVIMGHSFGAGFAALAAAAYPEDYQLCIGIGQPVCPCAADRLSYAWNLEQATKEHNHKALQDLERINRFWELRTPTGYFNGMMVNKKWVGYYGGIMADRSSFVAYALRNLLCHEYTVFDYAPYLLGMNFSGPASWEIMISTDLRQQAAEFKCPFVVMVGRQDFNVVPSLTEEYFNLVKAPDKKLFWFERSAHMLQFEEKELFQKIMLEEMMPLISR